MRGGGGGGKKGQKTACELYGPSLIAMKVSSDVNINFLPAAQRHGHGMGWSVGVLVLGTFSFLSSWGFMFCELRSLSPHLGIFTTLGPQDLPHLRPLLPQDLSPTSGPFPPISSSKNCRKFSKFSFFFISL